MKELHHSDYNLNEIKDNENGIVLSGMAGKFPDSENIYHFRENLFNKVDLINNDNRRWKPIHPEVPQRTGKLFNIERFDSGFFGITSCQSNHMDPVIRICLELSVEAIIDAGYNPLDFSNTSTAVITGTCASETENSVLFGTFDHFSDSITGIQRSMISKRISHALKLKGPSMIVDTACSSSLCAMEYGYSLIKSGKCDKALICGANLCLHPFVSLQFSRLGVLSRDGTCKSFDDTRSGYVRSEGATVCLLERAKDAKRVYANVLHMKNNCDGYKKEGITFPSSDVQKVLLEDFYEEAKIDPRLLTFMEAHGTGTKAGDPEELKTLDEILCSGRDRPLLIGTVKSNIGHNEPVSGLSSIVKIVFAMETGYIPPNLHYKKPIEGVEALEKGRMIVVTEKMPLPDDRGIFGINNFGFGGSNVHALLRWNLRVKGNNGEPKDNLPRLICVSSRTQEGVDLILDDYGSRNLDAEYTYLIQQVFRKPLVNNTYRGYGIYNKEGVTKKSSAKFDFRKRKLHLIFINSEKEWLKIGDSLLEIPIFAKSISIIHEQLKELSKLNLYKILNNKVQEGSVSHILRVVAIQIGFANMLKEINLLPDKVFGLGTGNFVAAYFNNTMTLKEVISNTFNKITSNKKSSKIKSLKDADDVIYIIIGGDSKRIPRNSLRLINYNSKDYIIDFLDSMGRLYEFGYDMELDKLYPNVKLPVSRGTPMLSPLLRWHHDKSYMVYSYKNEAEIRNGHTIVHISPKTEEWNFVTGHIIDGRNLFPATGYLILAWKAFAVRKGLQLSDMKVEFEDIKFLRAAHLYQDNSLELGLSLLTGFNSFEITEGGTIIVTGKIYDRSTEEVNSNSYISFDENELCLTEKDIYKELRIRGYHYTGKFRSIRKSNINASHAIVEWDENWITFMDSILQLFIIKEDTRNIYVPTSIQHLSVDAPKHIAASFSHQNMFPVELSQNENILRTGGIEIRGLGVNPIPRRRGGEPVLETYKFLPNSTSLRSSDAVRALVQLILENSNVLQAKVVEVPSEDVNNLLCPIVHKVLVDLPLIRQDMIVLCNKSVDLTNVTVENRPLETESNCLILILSNILETTDVLIALNVIKDAKGFIISRECLKVDLSKFDDSPLQVLSSYETEGETLVLLKPLMETQTDIITLDVSDPIDEFEWISKLQNLLKEHNKIILYAQNNPVNGLLGLINCLRLESQGNKLSAFFIMDKAPPFDLKLDFYKEQLGKNLAMNIWKEGVWGTYRHLLLPKENIVENEHCYVNVTTRGDLSSLAWIEGNLDRSQQIPIGKDLVHIYYAALNFRDLMTASGKLIPDAITRNRIEQECIQGFEFSGRNSSGKRVMGMCQAGALATMVTPNKNLIFDIPDDWTMEDAATVLVAHSTVLQGLTINGLPKVGQSILIHSATGGVGMAAINLSTYFGLMIFVTVGSEEKSNFIKANYPQIKNEHIGNSRDLSFELMIKKYTKNRGVDYVLNSLAEDKLLASVRCLARGGTFVEIGKFDLANNNALVLKLLEKDARFNSVAIDRFIVESKPLEQRAFTSALKKLLQNGAIKPLPRTIFQSNEIEQAFRYIGTGKHIGKVLIKVRNEEEKKIHSVPRGQYKSLARFHCNTNSSYIILGGLGGFGLELTDWLIVRGAKKLILTSKSGLANGYQKYRMRMWKSYGVEISTSTIDASTEEGCSQLLNIGNNLGPVHGIFNLAAVIKDNAFECQTVENFKMSFIPKSRSTKYLDVLSRELCPNLRYFVVFSSMTCGRGNIGQTNYGMTNSIMERICERRKLDGYPALAIQWGAIGEVGMVAKMQENHKELVISGTLQQRISSCLHVLDKLLKQDEPIVTSMLVAEKRCAASADNMFDAVLNILGVMNIKTVSMHSTFPEIGMDSMTAVEIKQTLEREYEIFLTAQDIKEMTLSKLKDISNIRVDKTTDASKSPNDLPTNIKLLLRYVGNENHTNTPTIKMKTLIGENENAPHIFALPGIEGTSIALEPLCGKLKAHVTCLQYCNESKAKTVEEITRSLFSCMNAAIGDIIILAYSYGAVIATELVRLLESSGRNCKVIFVDGSPEFVTELLKSYFTIDDEEMFQITLLCYLMTKYISFDEVLKQQKALLTYKTFEEKIDFIISVSPKVDVSKECITELCISAYNRLLASLKYKPEETKLKSTLILYKPTSLALPKIANDYDLSNLFDNQIDIISFKGDHVTILENDDLSYHINERIQEWNRNIMV